MRNGPRVLDVMRLLAVLALGACAASITTQNGVTITESVGEPVAR